MYLMVGYESFNQAVQAQGFTIHRDIGRLGEPGKSVLAQNLATIPKDPLLNCSTEAGGILQADGRRPFLFDAESGLPADRPLETDPSWTDDVVAQTLANFLNVSVGAAPAVDGRLTFAASDTAERLCGDAEGRLMDAFSGLAQFAVSSWFKRRQVEGSRIFVHDGKPVIVRKSGHDILGYATTGLTLDDLALKLDDSTQLPIPKGSIVGLTIHEGADGEAPLKGVRQSDISVIKAVAFGRLSRFVDRGDGRRYRMIVPGGTREVTLDVLKDLAKGALVRLKR